MQSRFSEAFVGVFTALLLVFLIVFLTGPQALFGDDVSRERGERIPGQYIIVFNDSVSDADSAENEILGRARGERIGSYRNAINRFAARFSDTELATLANDPRVAFVSEDRIISIEDREPRDGELRIL